MAYRLILGVEDEDISGMLYTHFEENGYQVLHAQDAASTLNTSRTHIPNLILLSTTLPDTEASAVVKELRSTPRTAHVPIICLVPQAEYTASLQLLEYGADDCVATPFDIEELSLRIENAIARSERENVTDPRSGLPGARLLDDHVRRLSEEGSGGWAYLTMKIEHFEPFREVNGFMASDEVLHMMANLLRDITSQFGTGQDFVSHPADDYFVMVTFASDLDTLVASLTSRFNTDALAHYSFMDREMGFLTVHRGDDSLQVPFMSLTVENVSPDRL